MFFLRNFCHPLSVTVREAANEFDLSLCDFTIPTKHLFQFGFFPNNNKKIIIKKKRKKMLKCSYF